MQRKTDCWTFVSTKEAQISGARWHLPGYCQALSGCTIQTRDGDLRRSPRMGKITVGYKMATAVALYKADSRDKAKGLQTVRSDGSVV